MSRFFKPEEAIKLLMLGRRDYQQRDKGRLMALSKYVWRDLNLSTVRKVRRQMFTINKRTNSIDMPCEFLQLSSVNVMDDCGNIYPVYRNDKIHDDIVDAGEVKNCACEYECGSELCNTIKSYEAVVETMEDYDPDGNVVSFECISRKGVDDQGFFYEQIQYPERRYLSGVWVETYLKTETKKLCKVEVDENGCVCDTESNVDAVCDACGIKSVNTNQCCIGGNAEEAPNDTCDTWIYYCNSKMDWFWTQCGGYPYSCRNTNNTYNISELGNRIIFPANFGWDKVMLRWYEDLNPQDVEIPAVALGVFIQGLMYWDVRFDEKKLQLSQSLATIYERQKFRLITDLNRYRSAELGQIISPPAYIPSYTRGWTNKYEG